MAWAAGLRATASAYGLVFFSWVSVLQNSKEEALNKAFKGDQDEGENNIVQELTKSIVGEVKKRTGNNSCCDCGAAGQNYSEVSLKQTPLMKGNKIQRLNTEVQSLTVRSKK